MHALTMAVGLWLGGAPVAPKQVSDFQALLARGGKLDPVLQHKGAAWKYVTKLADDGGDVQGVGTPVVDERNGFMHYEYSLEADHEAVDVALFTAADGRNFVATTAQARTERNEFSSFALYEFTGETFRDVTKEIGLPASLTVKDFMDSTFVATPVPKVEPENYVFKVEDAALLVIHLPRKGTTVTVDLEMAHSFPPIDDGPKLLADAQKLLKAHRKVKAIELAWDKADAKFTLAKTR